MSNYLHDSKYKKVYTLFFYSTKKKIFESKHREKRDQTENVTLLPYQKF